MCHDCADKAYGCEACKGTIDEEAAIYQCTGCSPPCKLCQ
eukprot:gene36599-55189_t